MKSILDRSFRYRSSVDTDLKATFARLRRAQQKQGPVQAGQAPAAKVVKMQPRGLAEKV
jgi:hypothetical protein